MPVYGHEKLACRFPSARRLAWVHAVVVKLGMKRLIALAGVVALLAACESSRSSNASTGTDSTDSTAVATTVPTTGSTAAPATDPATTVGDATTTTTGECETLGDVAPKESDDPLLMSSLIGDDIRVGAHPCFERVVIELGGTGDFPGWTVEYVDDPVRLGESDEFVEIAGEATLQVTTRVWMPILEGGGYVGPIRFAPENVVHILELRQIENHEGMCIWTIGLDAEYSFVVDALHDPERLVIDIQVPAGG